MAREDHKNWLNEAEWDLETSIILREQKRYNSSAFYAQQACEKLIKAALIYKNEAPWGHSNRELLLRLDEIVELDLSNLIHSAIELDHHYIPSRYPNAHPNSAPHEAYDDEITEKAIMNANLIFDRIRPIFIADTNKSGEEENAEND